MGIGLVAIMGLIFFSEEVNPLNSFAMGVIIGGAVILNLTSTV
ncbi:hypothetical protein MXE27_09215 [Methanobacterium alcaliphilum]|nr:hypothetical protein [Methanobacterium alcaliphilum]